MPARKANPRFPSSRPRRREIHKPIKKEGSQQYTPRSAPGHTESLPKHQALLTMRLMLCLSVEGRKFTETRPLNPIQNPKEDQTMPSDLSTIDLATLSIAREVIVASLRNQCCQWEQQSADAVTDGNLSTAQMLEHWAFSADLLASTVGNEFSTLFVQALDARMNWRSTFRSVEQQLLDTLVLEVASRQEEPEAIPMC